MKVPDYWKWANLHPPEQGKNRPGDLMVPQLKGLVGCWVKVKDTKENGGRVRRFVVGFRDCAVPYYVELGALGAKGGALAHAEYEYVRNLYYAEYPTDRNREPDE